MTQMTQMDQNDDQNDDQNGWEMNARGPGGGAQSGSTVGQREEREQRKKLLALAAVHAMSSGWVR